MPSVDDLNSLVLKPFSLQNRKIHFLEYAGEGQAGYVFRVRIDGKEYALKMFKFYRPEFNPTRLRGRQRSDFFDPFFIESRSNSAMIAHGYNGKLSPFCYGWINVPTNAERSMARKFRHQPFLWDRPPNAYDQEIRAILFDWIDGKKFYEIRMNPNIANQARTILRMLHGMSIAHHDISASNFLIQGEHEDQKVFIIDFSASIVFPSAWISAQKWKMYLEDDRRFLELGFDHLLELPINGGLARIADAAVFDGLLTHDITEISEFTRPRWSPPQARCWEDQQQESPAKWLAHG